MDLNLFKGNWVSIIETIHFDKKQKGTYSIKIINIENNQTILEFVTHKIQNWNNNAEFNRPKWGIYRSLKDSHNLKDEEILFADFKITEL